MTTKMFETSPSLLRVLGLLFCLFFGEVGSDDLGRSSEVRTHNEVEGCGPSNLTAAVGHFGTLQSPNYPNSYPPNSECWWSITAPLGYHVSINAATFNLETDYDFLQLYDATSPGEATQPYGIIRYENQFSTSILSNSHFVTIKFTSDGSVEYKGFNLTYEALAVSCGPSNLTAAEGHFGSLQSPNYPNSYPPNSECWWSITAPLGYHVSINAVTFNLETGYDFLQLYDATSPGEATQPYEIVRYENQFSTSILSNSHFVTIKFTSDGSVEYKGFNLTYEALAVSCLSLKTPINGRKTCFLDNNNNTLFCRFSCDEYFMLSDNEKRWCQSNGTWSGNDVSCERQTCSALAAPDNGTIRCTDGKNFGSRCNITCNDGYQLFGSESRTCRNNLQWIGLDTSCHDCGPSNLSAAVRTYGTLQSPNYPNNYPPNSECWWTITAPLGYYVLINTVIFYLETGYDFLQLYDAPSQVDSTQPYATIGSEDVSSTSILSNSHYVTVKFTSDNIFQFDGFSLFYAALAYTCSTLETPINGGKTCYVNNNNNRIYCRFLCHENFTLSNNEQRWCQSNGRWSGNEVSCERQACSELAVLENGTIRCTNGTNFGSRCNFTCNVGYQLSGSETRKCTSDLQWDGSGTSCNECGPSNLQAAVGHFRTLQSPSYPSNYPPNSECWWTITAPIGYHVLINTTSFDLETGYDLLELYDAQSPVESTQPYAIFDSEDVYSTSILSNSDHVTIKFTSDGSVEYKGFNLTYEAIAMKQEYFTLSDNKQRWCQSNGIWTGKEVKCLKKTCSKLSSVIDSGTTTCTDGNNIDSRCNFTCNDGYLLIGSESRTCRNNLQWNGSDTSCLKIDCAALPTPSNGEKICYHENNNIYCKFSCNVGFTISGTEQRWCQSNRNWTGNQVICEEKCNQLAVPQDGIMRCTHGNNIDSICTFTCNDGYQLFGSESRSCNIYLRNGALFWLGHDTSCQGSPPTSTCSWIGQQFICDGRYDCSDKSDEKGCTCPSNTFECDCYETGCSSKNGCIDESLQCDGKNDCGDWSDEWNCQCSHTRFKCGDGDCIDRSKVNDGKDDCANGDDEFHCDMTQGHVKCDCMHDDERCTSSGRCIPNSWIGDTVPDCENHDDEPCKATKIWCDKCWVIINQCSNSHDKNYLLQNFRVSTTICRSLSIPSIQTQIPESNWICTTSSCGKCQEVFCCDSGQFIDNVHYCDIIPQCKDGSDEQTTGFGFRCSGISGMGDCVLPQKNVNDSVAHCADSSDLCFVNREFRCFFCLDGRLIVSAKQVCDGLVDCYDMSDECLCANQSVCDAVRGKEKSICPSNQMYCHNDTCEDLDEVLCNSSVDCINGNNKMFCHQDWQSNKICNCSGRFAVKCDGRPECKKMEDECDECESRPSFCDHPCGREAITNGRGDHVCDGLVNNIKYSSSPCDTEIEYICPMRFVCESKDKVSIDKRLLCDGIIDCDDHSDEDITDCANKRFYCTKGKAISIDKTFVCNGIEDCDEGEDEAPQLCAESTSLFSDQYEMIASPTLRVLFWIMGLLSLSGNILINVYTAKNMLFGLNKNPVKLANDVFVLNLTISDFLMGVYLIAVVVQGSLYSGSYGLVDKQWRSSNLCSGLGTLALLSSETSAFIMAALSTFRLLTVYKPFLLSSIKIKWIVIAGCSCWILSILLAVIPWLPFDSGYFISDVWFPNLFFKSDPVSQSDMFALAKRVSADDSSFKSWFKAKEIISDAFKFNPIKGEFGYYSETSVCMPRFFASTIEAAWQYSISLIALNFMLFAYMLICYFLVCKKAKGMQQSRCTKKDPNKGMQKRISRLLLTDFCCWIPVCIMGYLSVAGVPLPANAYVASAGFLLPINSAMNPILYSKFIDRHASQTKKWIIQRFSCICSCSADENEVVERCDGRVKDSELGVIETNDQTQTSSEKHNPTVVSHNSASQSL